MVPATLRDTVMRHEGGMKVKWRFAVDGPLFAYRAGKGSKKRTWGKRGNLGIYDPRYKAFKDKVGWLAVQAGVPVGKIDPKESHVKLSVFIYWKNLPRFDWSNGYKAVEDALFEQDRYVQPGGMNGFNYSSGRPDGEVMEVLVEVTPC